MDDLLAVVSDDQLAQPIAEIKQKRSEFARNCSAKDDNFKRQVAVFAAQERAILKKVVDASMQVPELFIGPKDPGFVTQYDLIQEGGIYIPEINKDLTMAELDTLFNSIVSARKVLRI